MNAPNHKSTIFVSGGSTGLGLQISEHFVKNGNSIIFCARNQSVINSTIVHLKKLATVAQLILGFSCDVSDQSAVDDMFLELTKIEVAVDVLICNAGVIGPIDKFLESDSEEWKAAFNINLYGTMNLIKKVLPGMVSRGRGRVIHISGGGATSPLFGMSSYAASKAAAVRFIETLALEYKDSGVSFNSIAPGMLKTQLLKQMLEAGRDRIGDNLFVKSTAKADATSDTSVQAIELIDFLASESSMGITGKLISAEWDNWPEWPRHLQQLGSSDLYTLRRITGRDRGQSWGDI